MSWVWSKRSRLYLLGVAGLVAATLAYTLGHVAPYWLKQDGAQNQPLLNIGLWLSCEDGGSCIGHYFAFDQDSMKAVRILQVLGLATLVIAVVLAIFANCRRQHPGPSFFLEVVIVLGVVLGFSGSMVYIGDTREDVENSSVTHYDWALALNIAASLLALVSAILIFIANIREYLRSSRAGHADRHVPAPGTADYHHPQAAFQNGAYVKGWGSSQAVDERPVPEPPKDYHHDNAVYFLQDPAYHQPPTNLHFHPNPAQGDSVAAEGFQDTRWRMIRMKGPPPRGAYDERGFATMDPAGPRGRAAGYPGGSDPPGPFTLPRVIVRGYYVPGYGYPEYTML